MELKPELRRDSSVEPGLQAGPKPKRSISVAETGTGDLPAVVGIVELDPASHQTHLTQPDDAISNPTLDSSSETATNVQNSIASECWKNMSQYCFNYL